MEEIKRNETHRQCTFIRILGITVLLLVMAVNIANAEQTIIDSITTNPEHPIYVNRGSYYMADFTVTVHVTNPPAGGHLAYYYGCGGINNVLIDNNGMGTFEVRLQIAYDSMYGIFHTCPPGIRLYVYDDQGNVLASAQKEIDTVRVPLITWNPLVDISTRTPLNSKQLNAVAAFPGYSPLPWISIPGTFVYTPAEGTVLSAGTHTLHVDFTPDDTEKYTTASKDVTINVWNPINPTSQITWNNPADIIYGTPLTSTQLNAVLRGWMEPLSILQQKELY